jgi:hypothetical protein
MPEKGLGKRLAAVRGLDHLHPFSAQEVAQGMAGLLRGIRNQYFFRGKGCRHGRLD